MCITNVMAHGSGLRVYLLLYLGQPHEVSFPFRSLDLRAGYHNFNESIRSRDIPRNDNDTMLIFGWATMLDLSLSLATLYHLRCPFNQALCCHASARVGTMRFESQMNVSIPPLPGLVTLISRENACSGEDLTTNDGVRQRKVPLRRGLLSCPVDRASRSGEDKHQFPALPARFISSSWS